MRRFKAISCPGLNDAVLVSQSIAGNRDAFEQIVARYQSLICSLAYSATGSLSQSEDLAQDTFLTAWKQLNTLREPQRLRSWLCGIARNLIRHSMRRQAREPACTAEGLEAAAQSPSAEPLPMEQVIGKEEETILWRSLESIPEIYREPLVLFYRENQSAVRVAQALGLSENAVHQRLVRGRKLLAVQVQALVEGALERTKPDKRFTLGVVAALPLAATSAKTAAAGATAAKSGALAKVTGWGAGLQVLFKMLLGVGPFVTFGGWLGYRMGTNARTSQTQHRSVVRFWVVLMACLFLFVLLPLILWKPLMAWFGSSQSLHSGLRTWLDLMYTVLVAALALWCWQQRKSRLHQTAESCEPTKPVLIWLVVLAMIAAGAFFVLGLSDTNWRIDRLSTTEAKHLIETKGEEAQFFVCRYRNGDRRLWIKLKENGRVAKFTAPAVASTLSLLTQKGIQYPTYLQGHDFEVFGWQGKLLMGLCLFILAAGTTVLLAFVRKIQSASPLMTTKTKIGIAGAVVLAVLIVTPFFWHNYREHDSVHLNRIISLTPIQSAQARQTARGFLEALSRDDWTAAAAYYPAFAPRRFDDLFTAKVKREVGGLKIIRIGVPYIKAPYPGVFVPYEIRFKNGQTKTFRLAVRQDNPQHKWYFDGGL